MLSDLQIERYSRQIILPQVGGQGQKQLLHAQVLVSGNGPLQAQALLYLSAAGIGRVGIHGAGRLPLWAAFSRESQDSAVIALSQLNPDCAVVVHDDQTLSDQEDIVRLVEQYDIVIAEPHPQLHAACYAMQKPFVCGQVLATTAWLAVYCGYEENRPCFACEPLSFSEMPSSSDAEACAAPFMGTLLATEAIKLILGLNLIGPTKLLHYRFSELSFHDRILVKNPNCSVCRR